MISERRREFVPEDSADLQYRTDQRSREKITLDSRFITVIDKAPVVYSWEIVGVPQRRGLVRDAVVQRTMQAYGTYYKLPEGVTPETAKLKNFGIGFEDKLPEEPEEGMAKYFAKEGKIARDNALLSFPSNKELLERLVEEGFIQDGGTDFSRVQLNMLVKLDDSIHFLAKRLNGNPARIAGNPAYDRRKKIHDYLLTAVREENLIEYRNGNRLLALPRARIKRSDDNDEVLIQEGNRNLSKDLASLSSANERKDWEFLRSAVFLLSDPKIREVLEANRQVSESPRRTDDKGRIMYAPTIRSVVGARLSQYKK